jgi:hypothetical protein
MRFFMLLLCCGNGLNILSLKVRLERNTRHVCLYICSLNDRIDKN